MDSITDSDHQAMEDATLDPRAGRGGRTPGARPSGKVPWTAWAGFGGNWLSAPDSYWRRRFFILAAWLAVLCEFAWAMSALLGPAKLGPAKPIERAGASQAADNRMTLPPAAYGPPLAPSSVTPSSVTPSAGTASPTPTTGVSAPGTPSASGPGASLPATSVSAGQSPSVASPPGRCPSASIVLSLFSAQPKYGPSQQPRFTVYVVSTAPGTCQLAYMPPFAYVIVTRNGEVVWDSASCAPSGGTAGGAAQQMPLTEGVPKVTTLSWNRKATSPGCAGWLPSGASGTFDAVAMAAGKSSPVRTITLTRE